MPMDLLKAPRTVYAFAKANLWIFLGLVLVLAILVIRMSETIKAKILESAPTSAISGFMAKLFGYTVPAVAALCVLALGGDAVAATAGHVSSVANDGSIVGHVLGLLGALGTLGLGYVTYPFQGVFDLQSDGNKLVETMEMGTSTGGKTWTFTPSVLFHRGSPIKARKLLLNFKFTVDMATSGVLSWEMLANMIKSVRVWTPLYGVLHDPDCSSGPELANLASWVANGYKHNQPHWPAILADGTYDYTLEVPLSLPCLEDEADTAQWVGFLTGMQVTIKCNDGNYDETVGSVTATTASVQLVPFVDNQKDPWKLPPLVCFSRYDISANASIKTLNYKQVGSQNGPAGAATILGERVVFAAVVSNAVYLPGAGVLGDILEFGCPELGVPVTSIPEGHINALMDNLDAGGFEFAHSGLYANTGTPLRTLDNSLKCLPVVAASRGGKISLLPVNKGPVNVRFTKTAQPESGVWPLYVVSLRDVDRKLWPQVVKLCGGTDIVDRDTLNGESAVAAVGSREMDSVDYVGIPAKIRRA